MTASIPKRNSCADVMRKQKKFFQSFYMKTAQNHNSLCPKTCSQILLCCDFYAEAMEKHSTINSSRTSRRWALFNRMPVSHCARARVQKIPLAHQQFLRDGGGEKEKKTEDKHSHVLWRSRAHTHRDTRRQGPSTCSLVRGILPCERICLQKQSSTRSQSKNDPQLRRTDRFSQQARTTKPALMIQSLHGVSCARTHSHYFSAGMNLHDNLTPCLVR